MRVDSARRVRQSLGAEIEEAPEVLVNALNPQTSMPVARASRPWDSVVAFLSIVNIVTRDLMHMQLDSQ